MTRILVNAEMREKLQGLHVALEFCDESGRVLGTYTPAPVNYQEIQMDISKEEFDRRVCEDERLTTAQVLEHLESL